ncbi:glycosyltransferase [Polaribacter litorisediminis]|uniref:glycosyltransferase n=1 Tax=Polaribacter litorisediminis TaxID=1908341 RepID=UPI001CC03798|nr:glycosyltransferase [Polaribacter litorisediminis]UAM96625.1 glycosyltransferase [Polaribacter litorisediminis]
MKICIIQTPAFNPNEGGVQRITYNLGKHFLQRGFEVTYFSFASEGHISSKHGELFTSKHFGGTKNEENLLFFRQFLHETSPDIVINQMPYEDPIGKGLLELKKEIGFHTIACLHNSLFAFKNNLSEILKTRVPKPLNWLVNNPLGHFFIQYSHRRKQRGILKKFLDDYDSFVTEALPNQEELKYFVGDYKIEKVKTIPNPFPGIEYTEDRKEKIILHVGRINIPQKRSDLLLPFWAEVAPKLPDWKFVIVGDGPYLKQLKENIDHLKIQRVEVVGFKKPETYYQKASIFMMPSAYEGLPNTIIEAQNYGCPVVAFNSYAAVSWIVNNSQDALLVAPFDTKEMGRKVVDLVSSPFELKRMRINSLKNSQRFSIKRVGRKWELLFQELQDKNNG